ncbi:unnamed protein product [Calypogeia fissa]
MSSSSFLSSSSLLISRHLLSPSSASSSFLSSSSLSSSSNIFRLPFLQTFVDPDGRSSRTRGRRGFSGWRIQSFGSDDGHGIRRYSFPTSCCHIAKQKKRNLSSFPNSGAFATAALIPSLINSTNPKSSSLSLPTTTLENEVSEILLSKPTSAYVHLPFCRRRCFYCDFTILAVGERTEQTKGHIDSFMSDYVDLVCREIAKTAVRGHNPPLKTVFFGGGTPSLVPVPLLAKIIEELKSSFGIAADAEISMEMDPGTFNRIKLAGFLECGVTRMSLGVQSFQEELLKACGRAHGVREVYDAVDAIRWNGLKNWSLDLIASLPNQTLQHWEHSLEQAVSLKPAHVSVYDLQIEEGTLFNRWFKAGQDPLPSDEKSAELYCTASRRLREAGFEHYEVSNYAIPGFQCRHNLVYWENQPYYAFGLGSTSYVKGRRFSRPKKLKEYEAYVQNLDVSKSETMEFVESSSTVEDQILDTVMLSLRLARGLNLTRFEAKFGQSLTATLCSCLVPFVEKGLVEAVDAQRQIISGSMYVQNWKNAKSDISRLCTTVAIRGAEGCVDERDRDGVIENPKSLRSGDPRRAVFVRLTDPEGFLLSNEVISSVFAALPSGDGG